MNSTFVLGNITILGINGWLVDCYHDRRTAALSTTVVLLPDILTDYMVLATGSFTPSRRFIKPTC